MTTFSTHRQFAAPPDVLFGAISDPECLAIWWGPVGFINRFAVFEFKAGGKWIFTMVGPDGKTYPNEAMFAVIEVNRKVVIQHTNQPRFQLTITLAPSSAGTRLQWDQTFEDASIAEAIRHIVEPSNEQNLDRLNEILSLQGAITT